MSKSRLLYSSEDDSDEEFTLNPVSETPRHQEQDDYHLNHSQQEEDQQPQRHYQYYSEEEEEDDDMLEAPNSLLVDPQQQQQRQPTLPIPITTSTRERVSTYDRTMWRWANVENMDDFFTRVYEYYQGKGLYCILLARLLNLLWVVDVGICWLKNSQPVEHWHLSSFFQRF